MIEPATLSRLRFGDSSFDASGVACSAASRLGWDGNARALRGEFDPRPPFVCAPTYATADKELAWLNRAQCLIVGRVDMKALTVESDAYLIEVGGPKNSQERPHGGGLR